MNASALNVEATGLARLGARVRRFLRVHWYAYAMLTPVLVVTVTLVGYPLLRGVYLSLTDANANNIGNQFIPASYEFVGLKNYLSILSGNEGHFYSILWRTVVWTAVNVFFHYTIAMGLALMLNRKLKGRGLYRTLLMVPWAMPQFVAAFAWGYMYNGDFGIFNQVLGTLGFEPRAWLNEPFTAFVAVIIVNVWLGIPFMMVALLGGMQSISQDLYEAASIDGANGWQKFRYITMPGLRSVSSTVILLGTIWTFNMFVVIYLITRGGPYDSTQILGTYAYRQFIDLRQFAVAATYGVLILSSLVVFASAYRRVLRRQGEAWA